MTSFWTLFYRNIFVKVTTSEQANVISFGKPEIKVKLRKLFATDLFNRY